MKNEKEKLPFKIYKHAKLKDFYLPIQVKIENLPMTIDAFEKAQKTAGQFGHNEKGEKENGQSE